MDYKRAYGYEKAFMSITLLVLSLSMVMMLLMGVVTDA